MPNVLKMYPSWRLNSRIFMGLTMFLPHVQTDLESVKIEKNTASVLDKKF